MGSEVSITCACGEKLQAPAGAASIPCPKCGKSTEVPPAAPAFAEASAGKPAFAEATAGKPASAEATAGKPAPPAAAPAALPAPPAVTDGELEHVLLKKGWATLDQLKQARQKLSEELAKGRNLKLGDALVEMKLLTPERLKEASAPQTKVPMKCPTCAKTYYVKGFRPGSRALCKSCKVALVPVGSITDIHPEDVTTGTDLQQVPVGEAVDPAWIDLIPGYHIERRLGTGGMGQVFLARQKSLDRLVAVKVLSRKLADNPDYVKRFLAEARSAAKLNHENIVLAVDTGQVSSFYYFVMEYVEGETLQSVISREGALPERRALEIARQIATGLWQASQQGLIHRDIKPANIMITPAGQAKICDFGLAREVNSDARITQEGTVHSSPAYASPEQCKAVPNLDQRSDMYSLGVTLFEMVTGQLPFKSEAASSIFVQHVMTPPPEPRSINPTISTATNTLILRMLRKEPDKRFRDYGELLSSIVAARQNPGAPAPEKRKVTDTRKSRTAAAAPGPLRWVIAAAAALLLIIGAAVLLRKGPAADRGSTGGSAAEQDLKDARAFEKAAKGKPSEYPQVRARWKAMVEKYRSTPSHNSFAGPLVEFETRMSEEAERLAEDVLRDAATRFDAGRLLEALFLLKGFPRGFEDTPGGRRVSVRAQDVERILDEKYQQGREAVAASVTAERFDEAMQRLEALRSQVSVTGPAGVEFARLSYRDELNSLARQVDEERLLARKRELEANAKNNPPKPPPVVRKDPPVDVPPVKVVTPEVRPPDPPPTPVKRRPVPDAAALRESEKLIRDLFKEEYAKKTGPDKVALARKLMELADQTKDDPPGRFVLLREARDLAIGGGNLTLAFAATDEAVREFDIDGAALKGAALVAIGQTLMAPDEIKSAAVRILKYVDEAVAAEDFEAATKAAAAVAAMARRAKDIPLLSKADAKVKELDEWKSRVEKLKKANEALAKNPNDPEACLAVGQYQCVVRGDWASGLPLLAKGSNPVLKGLAQKDLAAPGEPAAQVALGDEWWDAGETALGKDECRIRAAYWYRQAVPRLAGFTKTKVEKRLAEIEELKKK